MKYAFTANARYELSEIVAHYAQEDRRLAVAFVEALDRVLSLLIENPRLGHLVSNWFAG